MFLSVTLTQIFTETRDDDHVDDRLKPDIVVDYLSKFSLAVILYLEYLVFSMKLEVCFTVPLSTDCCLVMLDFHHNFIVVCLE